LTLQKLNHTAFSRYSAIRSAVETELTPLIELRNKLAHGQWEYALNSEEDGISQEMMRIIKTLNILVSIHKIGMADHFAQMTNDLIVSKSFERDFDFHYRRFDLRLDLLAKCDFQKYCSELVTKSENGKIRRRDNVA
jgi:hypothetical protein